MVAISFSCNSKSGKAEESGLFYFPEKNTYYDVQTASYYYSLDSARTWDSLVYNQNHFGASLGTRVVVSRSGRYNWSKNDSHRKVYNGRILNLVNNHTISLARADSMNRIKATAVTRSRPIEKEEEVKEEPPKKGLKKFFNKIFGKKKDKKDQ